MMYRYRDDKGQWVYSDRMPTASETSTPVDYISNGMVVKKEAAPKSPHDEAKGYIGDARKHIPKMLVYLDYIEYLSKNNPVRYHAYMLDIKKNDPKTFVALTQARVFQPLQPHQRLSNLMDTGVSAMGDLFAGRSGSNTATTYAEKTLTEYMKKDGFTPGNVLGNKATTLPQQVPTYSNSRLGQWSKKESERLAKLSKEATATTSGRPLLKAASTTATRVGGPVLDVMIGALDPQMVPGIGATVGLDQYVKNLRAKGIELWDEEIYYLRGHLARNDWEAARNLVREAALRNAK
ncbi:MAG: hypothetical protein U1C13_20510 [Pseudomonas sp.]|nr:hypothetical protein [Pseudomonas sp.]